MSLLKKSLTQQQSVYRCSICPLQLPGANRTAEKLCCAQPDLPYGKTEAHLQDKEKDKDKDKDKGKRKGKE